MTKENIYSFKYKKINNFLNESEIELLKNYTIIQHRLGIGKLNDLQSDDFSFYGDPLMESILLKKKEKMQELTGLKLLPTYSYYRMYTYLADLKKHKDRPSCEISVSVSITSSGEDWPIYMNGNAISLNAGDAVIYLGQEVEHWREEFDGDHCAQVFLHYVNKNGKHAEWIKDKRRLWGQQK